MFWDPWGLEVLGSNVKKQNYDNDLAALLEAGVSKSEAEMSLKTTTAPITVVEENNNITIYVYANVCGSGADTIISGTQNIDGTGGITYREAVINGIVDGWSGEYDGKSVDVVIMDIGDGNQHYLKEGQGVYEISINSRLGISNHRGWYSTNLIGKTNLYFGDSRDGENATYYTMEVFSQVAAHEFGHALGISDAYDAASIKNPIPSIMYDPYLATGAQTVDYAMMLQASRENSFQYWNKNLSLLDGLGIKYE